MKHVIALSGGYDSTAMALRLKELNPSVAYEYVITPTGDELPEMEDHWVKLEGILGPLKRLATIDIFELIDREGMLPNYRARFCTRVLKIEPFIDYMQSLPPGSVMYVGLRADEETRLGLIPPDGKFKVRFPMKEWGWKLSNVVEYLARKGVEIPERTDCGLCFFQRLPEWRELLYTHPVRYEKYASIERKYGYTFRSPQRDTWPADLDGLKTEILSGRKMRETKRKGAKRCRFCSM